MTKRDARWVTKRDTLWQLGDLLTKSERLTRSIPIELRKLPPVKNVSICGGYLKWEMQEPEWVISGAGIYSPISEAMQTQERNIEKREKTDMLEEFTRLHSAPETEILEFARLWGPLQLCVHNVPFQHAPPDGALRIRIKIPPPDEVLVKVVGPEKLRSTSCGPLKFEPISSWRFFSRQAEAMLKIAAALSMGEPAAPSEWDHVLGSREGADTRVRLLSQNQTFLLEAIREWMRMGSFHPRLKNLHGEIGLSGADLFAKLSLELALAVSRTEVPTPCSICGCPYRPLRKPARGRANICSNPDCHKENARRRKAKSRRLKRGPRVQVVRRGRRPDLGDHSR